MPFPRRAIKPLRNRNLYLGSEAAYHYGMHSAYDMVGAVESPARYLGVRALPFNERIHGVLSNPQTPGRMEMDLRLAPDSPDKALDRVSFRDGFDPQDAYLFLATSQDMFLVYPTQNNSIARYTDLGDIWLSTNTYDGSTWSRSVVNISTGGSFVPRAACQLEAMANLGEVSLVSSREPNSGGADWTRTIVHRRGHYFVVLDRLEALQEDDYTFVCRWRSLQSAALDNGVWTATAPGGNVLRIQSAEDVVQTSEVWPCDGSANPSLLQAGHFIMTRYPIAACAKNSQETGWKFNTGGPCGTAVLAEDFNGDGVPEVLLARQDGFVNVFKLADGSSVGRLSTGEPIIGMALLQGKDGKPCLAVGTKFSVQLFARDPSGTGLTRVGKSVLPALAAAFAGPGGPHRDRVFVVDSAGQVSVLVLK